MIWLSTVEIHILLGTIQICFRAVMDNALFALYRDMGAQILMTLYFYVLYMCEAVAGYLELAYAFWR